MIKRFIKPFIEQCMNDITDLMFEMEQEPYRDTIVYAAMDLRLKFLFLKMEIYKALIGVE